LNSVETAAAQGRGLMLVHKQPAKFLLFSFLFAFIALAPAWATAGDRPFDRIVVFGDSLSDPGNAFALTHHNITSPDYEMVPEDFLVPSFPYAKGGNHVSNGPTWIEDLGAALGLASDVGPALRGASSTASNYAVAGARARAVEDEFHFALQVEVFLRDVRDSAPSDALYVIAIGGNDVRDALAPGSTSIPDALAAIALQVQRLHRKGAKKFFVTNAPNIALAPAVRAFAATLPPDLEKLVLDGAQKASVGFKLGLDATLAELAKLPGIQIMRFDLFTEVNGIVENPAAFGLSDVTHACITPNLPPFQCQNPDRHLFWDGIHPTRAGHAIVAKRAGAALLSGPLVDH
jgi:phospholipase/lecithinase/hemolysin